MTISVKHLDIIRSAYISEKATFLNELGKYVFAVSADASKTDIKKAIESLFNVKVRSMNVVNIKGKVKRFRGRIGVRSDVRKAIVTLHAGQTIDLSSYN